MEFERDSQENQVGDDLEKRKKQVINFLKEKKELVFYLILAFLVFIGTWIRTLNISKLKDITTNTWTLGPDLDPFLFLRWAKYIVENGKLFVIDTMRNVPLGHDTSAEMKLLSYLIAWFYQIMHFLSSDVTVTYAAIWFPVVMFGLTIIAFFLFSRKIFYKEDNKIKNIIALISTTFFIVIPSLLPRTIAGIPEKESAAFFFIFISFYFFLEAFTSKSVKKGIIFSCLAGITTGALGLIWGGVGFVLMTIAGAVLFSFLLGKIKYQETLFYFGWLMTSFIIMMPFSTRYTLENLITSTSTGIPLVVLFILIMDIILKKQKFFDMNKIKLPKPVSSLIISICLILVFTFLFFGFSFIYEKALSVIGETIHPMDQSRFGLTVAENKQPFFLNDWKNNFGPILGGIPLFFWLFFSGSIVLFGALIKKLNKKEKTFLIFSYLVFLMGLIFSKYSSSSILNGDGGLSLLVYFGGVLFFLGSFGYFYYQRYKEDELDIFKKLDFSIILYFVILTMTIMAARGAIRLIMVLGAVSPVAVAFLIVKSSQKYFQTKDDTFKFFMGLITLIIILSSVYTFWIYYNNSKFSAENFALGPYQFQWQKAMSWVRENTPQNAVFAHWWDYGYWVQSIGERATILDGGNAITYWNHLMGRHVLTGPDETEALKFLYTHNGTHLLIDSTEIGKYTAYASIGSDVNYDRFSWIGTFLVNEQQTQETNNETIFVYQGGFSLDEDVVWNQDGKEILLPKRKAGVGAIILKILSTGEIKQPQTIFVYNDQQYQIPLRYAYIGDRLIDFNSGIDAGIFIFPKINTLENGGMNIDEKGALMYLSGRTIHSGLARYYLFNQHSDYFKLVHTEPNLFIENLNQQGVNPGDFVYYNGLQGPIKIWEINYPAGMEIVPQYLKKNFPDPLLEKAQSGEY